MFQLSFIKKNWAVLILVILFSVGLVGHILPITRSLMLMITEWFLLICSLGVLGRAAYQNRHRGLRRLMLWVVIAFILTFAAEVIGVATGLIFGNYQYGSVFGLQLWNTPLIIGLNWVMVVLGSILLVQTLLTNLQKKLPATFSFGIFKATVISVLTGLVAVIFDLILEPVAIRLDYWQWQGGIIPLQNYFAWFLIAVIFAALYQLMNIKIKSNLVQYYLGIQLVFFLGLLLFGV